ncbi:MAG: L,D-transpeptidase family protein [Sphingobium sp.]|uniref:L,D-transpeptidase family protein n=1 Tax=Sphingobium sp. TaxID=1912891 RepID=UPI0029A0ED46|nr:L,D-transpeptidase family protein [Sphingobium sp.]MDX3909204.1 L,D-transpeptidase family protein [Sphingobium sp.]
MSIVAVDSARRRLRFGTMDVNCAIGKGGLCAAADKHEGDGCTPSGSWPVRGALLRRDRLMLDVLPALPWRWTRPGDGWSDGRGDPEYNRPVRLPHGYSAETLQREDEAYDVIVVLGHNDAPPVPGAGSAIFFHCWVEARPTEGCVAIAKADMLALLPMLRSDTVMVIR